MHTLEGLGEGHPTALGALDVFFLSALIVVAKVDQLCNFTRFALLLLLTFGCGWSHFTFRLFNYTNIFIAFRMTQLKYYRPFLNLFYFKGTVLNNRYLTIN